MFSFAALDAWRIRAPKKLSTILSYPQVELSTYPQTKTALVLFPLHKQAVAIGRMTERLKGKSGFITTETGK